MNQSLFERLADFVETMVKEATADLRAENKKLRAEKEQLRDQIGEVEEKVEDLVQRQTDTTRSSSG